LIFLSIDGGEIHEFVGEDGFDAMKDAIAIQMYIVAAIRPATGTGARGGRIVDVGCRNIVGSGAAGMGGRIEGDCDNAQSLLLLVLPLPCCLISVPASLPLSSSSVVAVSVFG
jgi:hypothetical protein